LASQTMHKSYLHAAHLKFPEENGLFLTLQMSQMKKRGSQPYPLNG